MHSSFESFVCEEEKKVIESRKCRFKVGMREIVCVRMADPSTFIF